VEVTGSRLALTAKDEQILEYYTEHAGLAIDVHDLDGTNLLSGLLEGTSEESLTFRESESSGLAARSIATAPAKAVVSMKVNRANGRFSGVFRDPAAGGTARNFSGVLLQHQNRGSGLIMLGRRTGMVTLTPQ
jgi:hypothetical protein